MRFVAEIGLNYEGNLDLAREMIRQARWAGADVAKFQFGWRSGPGEINALDPDRIRKLQETCEHWGIELSASLITPEALGWARQAQLKHYKIASRTVVDRPDLCRKILADGKLTYVSLGMWNQDGFPFGPPGPQLRYLYCRSKYPTDLSDLTGFPDQFSPEGYFGYSDHCLDTSVCLLAIARGAQLIEKHFTLNKASTSIRDHVLSATPDEFRRMVEEGRGLARAAQRLRTPETTPA